MSARSSLEAGAARRAALRNLGLALARLAWVLLVGVTLAFFAAGLPAAVRQLGVPCAPQDACTSFRLYPQEVAALEQAGLSLHAYTTFGVVLTIYTLVPIYGAAVVLFWRRSGTWMAMYISFALILLGPTVFTNVSGPLLSESPAWGGVIAVLVALGYCTSIPRRASRACRTC
jgi:hypothetical protein